MNFGAKYTHGKKVITPDWRTHVIIGVGLWYEITKAFHFHVPWWAYLWVAIGSVLPDCDHPKAPAGKFIPLWLVMRHRTWTHTIWAVCIVGIGAWLCAGYVVFISLVAGYVIHMLLDSMTPSGVNWLYMGKRKAPTKR